MLYHVPHSHHIHGMGWSFQVFCRLRQNLRNALVSEVLQSIGIDLHGPRFPTAPGGLTQKPAAAGAHFQHAIEMTKRFKPSQLSPEPPNLRSGQFVFPHASRSG
jgi:hypothetical protein